MKYKNYTFLILVSLGLSACDGIIKSFKDTFQKRSETQTLQSEKTSTTESEHEKAPFTNNRTALSKAERALRDLPAFKGKAVFLYRLIHFYDDGRVILKLQNPENPNYVDEYTYRDGSWQAPVPVRLSKNDDVVNEVISLDKIPFTNAANVYRVLSEKRKEIGGEANDYTIYAACYDQKINWYPTSISNERYEYSIYYNEDGTLKSFEQK